MMYKMFKHIPRDVRGRLMGAEMEEIGALALPAGAQKLTNRRHCCPIGYLMLSDGWPNPYPSPDKVWEWLGTNGWNAGITITDVSRFMSAYDRCQIDDKAQVLRAVGCSA